MCFRRNSVIWRYLGLPEDQTTRVREGFLLVRPRARSFRAVDPPEVWPGSMEYANSMRQSMSLDAIYLHIHHQTRLCASR